MRIRGVFTASVSDPGRWCSLSMIAFRSTVLPLSLISLLLGVGPSRAQEEAVWKKHVMHSGAFTFSGVAEFNDDGEVDLTDAVGILDYLISGGMAPPAPFPDAGVDSTECR